MASKIPQSIVEDVLARVSIADVIGDYVKLQKRGTRLLGLCPFHNEKSPSFSVNAERNVYHCFGCGESGSTATFLMKHDGLTFPEAIRRLADRVGVRIEEVDVDEAAERRARDARDRYDAVMRAARDWYFEQLWGPSGAEGVAYLERRAVDRATAERFGLGYAPAGWSGLVDALGVRGFTGEMLEEAGLALRGKQGGFYDRFRNRLMFPVESVSKRVLAFSGRTLDPNEPAKYVNSPETAFYRKGNELFGLNAAAKEIKNRGEAVLVEGNFDVVSLHARGFTHVVAALGTAMTPTQAGLLCRFTQRTVLLYDGDNAGKKASMRALGVLLEAQMKDIRRVRLPDGVDPDDFVKQQGPEALGRLIAEAEPMLDVVLGEIAARGATRSIPLSVAFDEIARAIGPLADRADRERLLSEMARRMDADVRTLTQHVLRNGPRLRSQEWDDRPPPPSRPTDVDTDAHEPEPWPEVAVFDRHEQLLVELLADEPGLLVSVHRERLADAIGNPQLGNFVSAVARGWADGTGTNLREAAAQEEDPRLRSRLMAALSEPSTVRPDQRERAFADTSARLRIAWLKRESVRLAEEIRRIESREGVEAATPLYKEHGDLLRLMRSLEQGRQPAGRAHQRN